MKAWLNLRSTSDERAALFRAGLMKHGYEIQNGLTQNPGPKDILITWNRIAMGHNAAIEFFLRGRPVLVAENASWGNEFCGSQWYTIARRWHNQKGYFDFHGNERWDSLGVDLKPWRTTGETVVLPQRGIGAPEHSMPYGWGHQFNARIRWHPGRNPSIPLEEDLKNCMKVITWGSGAAIKAMMMGCRVASYMPNWIGDQDNTDEGRLSCLRNMAWCQWRLAEIDSGEAFARLLEGYP